MSGSREKLRAVFLAFVMVLSVFGGTVAFTGSAAATADTVQVTSSTPASSGQAITFDAGVSNLNTDLQVYVDADENGDLGFGETKIEVPANAEEISVSEPGSPGASVTADAKSVAQVGSVNALIAQDTSGGDSTVTIAADSADSLTDGDDINEVTDIQTGETTRLGSTSSVFRSPSQVSTYTYNVDIDGGANLNEGEILLFGGDTLSGASTVGIAGEGTSGETGTTTFTVIANSAPSDGDAVHRVDSTIDDTSDTNFDVNGDQTVFGSSNTVTDTITPTSADDSAIISVQQTNSLTPSGTNTPDASTNSFTIIEGLAGTGDSSSNVNYEIGNGPSSQTLTFGVANNSVNLLEFQDATSSSAFSGSNTLKLPKGVTVNETASTLNTNTVIGTGDLSGNIAGISISNNGREVTVDVSQSSSAGDIIRFTDEALALNVDPTEFNTKGGSDNYDLGAVKFDHSLGEISIDNPDLFNANQLNPGTTATDPANLGINQDGQSLAESESIDLDNVDAGLIGDGTAIQITIDNGVTFDDTISGDDIVPADADIDGDNVDELNTSAVTVSGNTLTIPISDPIAGSNNQIDFDVGYDQGLAVQSTVNGGPAPLTTGDVLITQSDNGEPAVLDQSLSGSDGPSSIAVAKDPNDGYGGNNDLDVIDSTITDTTQRGTVASSSTTSFGVDETSITLTADSSLDNIATGDLLALSSDGTVNSDDTFVIALEAASGSTSEIAVTGGNQTSFSTGDGIYEVNSVAGGEVTDTGLDINNNGEAVDSSDPIRFNVSADASDANLNMTVEATAASTGPYQLSDSSGSATLDTRLTVQGYSFSLSNDNHNLVAGKDSNSLAGGNLELNPDAGVSLSSGSTINITTNVSDATFDKSYFGLAGVTPDSDVVASTGTTGQWGGSSAGDVRNHRDSGTADAWDPTEDIIFVESGDNAGYQQDEDTFLAGDRDGGDETSNIQDGATTGSWDSIFLYDADTTDGQWDSSTDAIIYVPVKGGTPSATDKAVVTDRHINLTTDTAFGDNIQLDTSVIQMNTTSAPADDDKMQFNATVNDRVPLTSGSNTVRFERPDLQFNGGSNATVDTDNELRQKVLDDGSQRTLEITSDQVNGQISDATNVTVTLESDTGVTFDTSVAKPNLDSAESANGQIDVYGDSGSDGGDDNIFGADGDGDGSFSAITVNDKSIELQLDDDTGSSGADTSVDSGHSIVFDQLPINATASATNTTISVTTNTSDAEVTTDVANIIVANPVDPSNVFGDADVSEDQNGDESGPSGYHDVTGSDEAQDGEDGDDSTGPTVGSTTTGSVFVKDGGSGFGGATVNLELVSQPSSSAFTTAEVVNTTQLTTQSDGTAAFEFQAPSDASIGDYTINASTGFGGMNMTYAVSSGDATAFNVSGADNAMIDQSGLSGSPSENETAAHRVRIEDAGGNIVGDTAVDVNVQVSGGQLQEVRADISSDGTPNGNSLVDDGSNDRRDYDPATDSAGTQGVFYVFTSSTTPGDIDVTISEGGISDTGTATVFDAIDTVDVSANETTVAPGDTISVTATALTSDGTTVEVPRNPLNDFSSANTSVLQRNSLSEESNGGTFANGTVSATFDATGLGDANVNVSIAGASGSQQITVETQTDNFNVSNVSPDGATVEQGNNISTVSADIENTGNASGTQDIEFRIDTTGDGQLDTLLDTNSSFSVDAGETRQVTFSNIPTDSLSAGTYTHGVVSDDDTATASITISEPANASASVTFDDQTVTNGTEEVNVANANYTLADGTAGDYVVVAHVVNDDGSISSPVGYSSNVSGDTDDITVDLNASGAQGDALDTLTANTTLQAMLHNTSADSAFGSALTVGGVQVTDNADITVQEDAPAYYTLKLPNSIADRDVQTTTISTFSTHRQSGSTALLPRSVYRYTRTHTGGLR